MAEQTQNNTPEQNNLPSDENLLAGKYKNEEELQKGILELAKNKSGGNLEDFYKRLEKGDTFFAEKEEANNPSTPPQKEEKGLKNLSIHKDPTNEKEIEVNLEELENEYLVTGELSLESKAKMLKVFPSEDAVNMYFTGLNAKVESFKTSIFEAAGGEEQFAQLQQWGINNLKEGEIEFFNQAILSGDPSRAALAVEAIKSIYSKKRGDFNLLKGDGVASVPGGYKNKKEMAEDMSDPRYETDETYRKAVEDKLRRTSAF